MSGIATSKEDIARIAGRFSSAPARQKRPVFPYVRAGRLFSRRAVRRRALSPRWRAVSVFFAGYSRRFRCRRPYWKGTCVKTRKMSAPPRAVDGLGFLLACKARSRPKTAAAGDVFRSALVIRGVSSYQSRDMGQGDGGRGKTAGILWRASCVSGVTTSQPTNQPTNNQRAPGKRSTVFHKQSSTSQEHWRIQPSDTSSMKGKGHDPQENRKSEQNGHSLV